MPSLVVKLYSVFFKYHLKHKLQLLNQTPVSPHDSSFGVTTRSDEPVSPANPSFVDGVATKDIHIDPLSALELRIFLPDTVIASSDSSSGASSPTVSSQEFDQTPGGYSGYVPEVSKVGKKLPVVLQFHGGGFVGGSNRSVSNDGFCRRVAKLCDVIVIAVGYRLAPENRFPGAFEDGVKVLNWVAKQANLAECSKHVDGNGRNAGGGSGNRKRGGPRGNFDGFGVSMMEPWLAAHADPSRCVLLGVSCGANIAEYVCQKAMEAGNLLDPVKVVAQILMYPFFTGGVPMNSEVKMSNSYFYDKALCMSIWKLFLPEEVFSLDHPAANPLISRIVPLKCMPPTLTVVAEHDMMRDRVIAYSEELRRCNVDAPILDYKDTVHEFATLDLLLQTPQAKACAEDIAIWVKKYISLRGHEFSY